MQLATPTLPRDLALTAADDRHGATEGVPLARSPGLAEFLSAPDRSSVRP